MLCLVEICTSQIKYQFNGREISNIDVICEDQFACPIDSLLRWVFLKKCILKNQATIIQAKCEWIGRGDYCS